MTLRVRITVLTAVLIALASCLVGIATYVTAYRVQVATIDRGLATGLADARLKALEQRPRPLPVDLDVAVALGLVDRANGTVTVLRQAGSASAPLPFPNLTGQELVDAIAGPITVAGDPDYRVLVREANPNRPLVVAASPLDALQRSSSQLALGIILSAVVVTALGALTTWLMVRRFFRPVDEMVLAASAISRGDTDRKLPKAPRGTEIAELTDALDSMVTSLRSSIAETTASEERLRRFVSDASHEIRTPLTVIRGYAELLSRDASGLDLTQQRALGRIESESQRLDRLVTQLLVLERVQGQHPEAGTPFDLEPLVRDCFADLRDLDGGRPVDLDLDPAVIRGDADDWGQLVANLAQNIRRHTPPNSPVQVWMHARDGIVTLIVDDAGPGIPPAQRALALERLGRVRETPSSSSGGFGLGLSIAGSVAASSGAQLELADSPLGGLRVQIAIQQAIT
jgi:two-component system OmpR family sensor kinase